MREHIHTHFRAFVTRKRIINGFKSSQNFIKNTHILHKHTQLHIHTCQKKKDQQKAASCKILQKQHPSLRTGNIVIVQLNNLNN